MKRRKKQDWLEVGLKILGQAGDSGLTIERMTDELGVTKGSFYHHFINVQDFKEQLISHWADQYISTSSSLPDEPEERQAILDMVMEEAFGSVTEPEIAIRNWAQRDKMVRSFVERADSVRREFVLSVFQSMTKDESQALLMADMLSAMLIGSITILPRISPERVLDLYKEFKRLYGLGNKIGG